MQEKTTTMIDLQYISIPLNCSQLIYVGKPEDGSVSVLTAFDFHDGEWVANGQETEVNIGTNGFASPRKKREGDMKTPTGLYRIGIAFGYGDFCLTGLDYRKIEDNHYWNDEPEHENYNQWLDEKPECSAEKMLREDGLYRYGFVIEYNTNPVIPNRGSAIFAHVEKGAGISTHGCISIPEDHLLEILSWLDKKRNPHILMGV